MEDHRQDNTIAIIGLVVGGLGLLISLIPCVGVLGVFPGIIGVVLGLIAYFKAKDNGDKKTLSIVALSISGLTVVLAAFWYFSFKSVGNVIQDIEVKKYTNCESLIADMDVLRLEVKEQEEKMETNEGDLAVFKEMGGFIKKVTELSKLKAQADELGCEYERLEEDYKNMGNQNEIDSSSINE